MLLVIAAVEMPLLIRCSARGRDVHMHGVKLGMTRGEVAAIMGVRHTLTADCWEKDYFLPELPHGDGFCTVEFYGDQVVRLVSDRVAVDGVEVREGTPLTDVIRRLGKAVPDDADHIDSVWLCYDELAPHTRLAIQYEVGNVLEPVIHVEWMYWQPRRVGPPPAIHGP